MSSPSDEERIRRLERELADQRERNTGTRGCLYAFLGAVVGVVMAFCPCGLVLGFVSERGPGGDRVAVFVLGTRVYQTSGPPGTATSVRTAVSVVFCGALGLAGAVIGGRMGRASDG